MGTETQRNWRELDCETPTEALLLNAMEAYRDDPHLIERLWNGAPRAVLRDARRERQLSAQLDAATAVMRGVLELLEAELARDQKQLRRGSARVASDRLKLALRPVGRTAQQETP